MPKRAHDELFAEHLAPFAASLQRVVEHEARVPVRPPLRDAPALTLPAEGMPLGRVIEELEALAKRTPLTASRRFVNQLFGGRNPAATYGDMLAAALNSSMYTRKAAGVQTLVEAALIEHMAKFAGMEGAEGAFAAGGSMSALLAMTAARDRRIPGARDEGLGAVRARVYTSADSHYSILKNAGLLGLGRNNVVSIAVDEQGRMRPDALARAIAADRAAGHLPLLVNATSGTTVRGAFDPIAAIADVCEPEGVWLHVDGAFGGSVLLSERARGRMAGLERADSLTWDAHKVMGVPLTCSICLVREPGLLRASMDTSADYLFQEQEEEPGQRSLQCGRRNDALKLWAAWLWLGDEGYAALIDRLLALAQRAAGLIEAHPRLRLLERPPSFNVCFEVEGVSAAELCDALHAEQRVMVGHATAADREVVRLVCVHPDLSEDDLEVFFSEVDAVAEALRG